MSGVNSVSIEWEAVEELIGPDIDYIVRVKGSVMSPTGGTVYVQELNSPLPSGVLTVELTLVQLGGPPAPTSLPFVYEADAGTGIYSSVVLALKLATAIEK